MLKPRNTNLVLFKRISVPPRTRDVFVPSVRSRTVVFFAAFLLLVLPLFSFTRVNIAGTNLGAGRASALAADNLNFQARLQQSNGSIVPDGDYHVEFKLYNVSTGGAALWTETRTTGNLVRVVNGYLSVYLGDVTALPSTIPWDQQLYLTMNIGGTAGAPTWDGEMTPRLRLTAVPYAMQSLRSSELATSSGLNLATLSIEAPVSGNQTFVLQDQGAAGTYNILTDANAPTLLAGDFIQDGTSTQTANFNVQSANAASVTATIQGASGQTANILEVKADGVATPLVSVGSTGQTNFMNSADSNSAIAVRNQNNEQVLTIGTSDLYSNLIDNSSFESGVTGWTAKNGAGVPAQTSAQKLYDSNAMSFTTSAANHGVAYNVTLAPSTLYTFVANVRSSTASAAVLTLGRQDISGTNVNCTGTGAAQTITNAGWNRIVCTFTSGATITAPSSIYILQTDATARTLYVDGVALIQGVSQSGMQYSQGTIRLNSVINSPLAIRVAENSYQAFTIANAAGTNAVTVDTINNNMTVLGTVSAAGALTSSSVTGTAVSATGTTTGTSYSSAGTGFTTGNGFLFNTTSNALTTGKAISITGAAAGITADFSGSLINVTPTRTLTAAATRNDSGTFLNLTRSNTVNNAGATYNITGSLANLQSNCTQTAGVCNDSGVILNLNQQYANSTGAIINANGAGTGNIAILDATNSVANGVSIDVQSNSTSQYALRVTSNNGATTGINVRADGRVSIGNINPQAELDVTGSGVFSGGMTIGGLNTAGIVTNTAGGVLGTVTSIPVANGGTGATDAATARTNLSAAASGANSDITSLSGLTTALSVAQGGTGATSFTTNGINYFDGTKLATTAAGTTGQCLIATTGAAPTWGSCDAGEADTLATVTGRGATTATASTFSGGLTSSGITTLSGTTNITGTTTTIGDAATDRVSLTAQITGASPLVFQGTTDNAFATTLAVIDPTSNNIITLPNVTGTVITTGNLSGITATGTITSGTWNGTAVADTYVSDTLTIGSGSSVAWTALNSYPAACGANEAITALGDTVTCTVMNGTTASNVFVNGGNSFAAAAILGTNDSNDLQLETNGITRVTINATTGAATFTGSIAAASLSTTGNIAATGTVTGSNLSGTHSGTSSGSNTGDISVTGESYLTLAGQTITVGKVALGTQVSGTLPVANGGTGATDAATARTNLAAAASGANADITSLTGLTTDLSVAQGGTGASSFTQYGILYGNAASPIAVTAAGTTGQCLMATTGAAPTWGACGSGFATTSLNNLASVNIGATALNSTSNNLTLQTTTSGNIVLNAAGFTDLQDILQNSAGTLTIGDALDINVNANNAVNINTGTSTGLVTIGGGSGTFSLQTTNIDISAAGAISGATGIASTGNVTLSQNAASQFRIVATQAPTTDMMQVTNSGFPTTTTGVNGQQVDYFAALGVSGNEASASRFNITNTSAVAGTITNGARIVVATNATAGVIQNGIKIDNITAGASTDNALYLGTGWDNLLSYNGTSIINGTGVLQSAGLSGTYSNALTLNNASNSYSGTWAGNALTDAQVSDTLTSSLFVGSGSSTTAVDLGTNEVAGILNLTKGGTNANLTASNGGIVWTNASQMQILAGTATAGQCLVSGSNAAPTWSSCSAAAGGANTSLSNLTATNINQALNSTSTNLSLTTTTSGNIVLNSAGTIELQDNTNITGNLATTGTITTQTATATQDQIILQAAALGAARFAGTITNADLTSARTYTLPDASGTIITTGNTTSITSVGTITVGTWNGTAVSGAYGGTGQTTTAVGDLLVGAAGNAWNKLTIGGNGTCLTSNGTTASWGSCGTLQGAYDGDTDGSDAIIALTATDGGIILRDAATPLTTAFAVRNNGGTASYFNVSSTAVVMQDSSGNAGLLFDSTASELRVYENVASPSRYARIYYDTAANAAVFAASSGETQVGTAGAGGDINLALNGAATDKLNANKTYSLAGAYSGSDFNFTRNLTGTAYAMTGNLMKIEDTSSFTGGSSSPNLLYINQNNTSATGNLILARTGGTTDMFKVDVSGNVTAAGNISIAAGKSYTGAGAVTVSSASNTNLTLIAGGTGKVIIKPGTNSSSMFEVQNAGGTSMLLADSSANQIKVGVSDTTGTVFVLDTKTDSGDPTGANGGMYYNSNAGKFRCYENGAWTDCLSTSAYIVKAYTENIVSNTTLQDDDDLIFTIPAGQTWVFEMRLLVMNNSSAIADWKSAILATGAWSCNVTLSGSEPLGTAFPQATTDDCTTPAPLVNNTIGSDAGIPFNVYMQGIVTAGASNTTVKLQWTQNNSSATSLSVLGGSYLTAQRVGGSR